MPQPERLRVWKGELLKTSGGLTIKDLMKNKRGKIVSKRKSQSAKDNANNLGDWLRKKGDNFFSKGITKDNVKKKGAAPGPKPKKHKSCAARPADHGQGGHGGHGGRV